MLSEPIDMATTPSFFGTLRSFAKRQHGVNEQPDFAVTKVRGYLFLQNPTVWVRLQGAKHFCDAITYDTV